ncbi:MAG: 2-dehydropantoate 2-reductase N-terminal domain-containing protein, partial [Candidatus Bathyarchaeota archaeon]|nr:2-dehydropantoate 2-reductase N-terminal domain-containing protein [Candidatus Bathyarchaeota archaeon]
MRFIIYGAGAVGSIIGGHMYKANNDVLLIANTHHVNIINKNGLELNTPDDKYILDIPAYNNISRIKSFKDDDVIFLT